MLPNRPWLSTAPTAGTLLVYPAKVLPGGAAPAERGDGGAFPVGPPAAAALDVAIPVAGRPRPRAWGDAPHARPRRAHRPHVGRALSHFTWE
jgi:hypothetical protein